jgi:hypothetical protein
MYWVSVVRSLFERLRSLVHCGSVYRSLAHSFNTWTVKRCVARTLKSSFMGEAAERIMLSESLSWGMLPSQLSIIFTEQFD